MTPRKGKKMEVFLLLIPLVSLASSREIYYHCSTGDEYLYATPETQCSGYYKCQRSQVTHFNCEQGSYFNFFHQSCVRFEGVCYESVCSGNPNGHYVDTTHSCRRYFACEDGQFKSISTCPLGQLFNGISCAPEASVNCGLPVNNAIAYIKAATVAATPRDLCHDLIDGHHSDPASSNCQGYLSCLNGKLLERLHCGDQGAFDEVSRKCIPSQVYNCPANHIQTAQSVTSFSRTQLVEDANKKFDICKWKSDGYYKDLGGSCRSYYYCANGKKFTYLCAENQVFDGDKCVLKDTKDVGLSCGRSECTNRPDGYYQNFASGCRKYHYCLRGEKATVLTCRDMKVFNGLSCVSPSAYNCASDTRECVQRSCRPECEEDGFYADYEGGCKSYYFCIAGNKSVLSCSEGYVFNGESCVSELNYKCPKVCEKGCS